jgi:hypothetical protein
MINKSEILKTAKRGRAIMYKEKKISEEHDLG